MFESIRAIAMDFDGVLTDGGLWWGAGGEEFKRLCFADVTGIARGREAGITFAIVSGESSPAGMALVRRFAEKVKITDVFAGCHDKATAVREFAEKHQLQLSEVCFIGDDVIDLPAMAEVGLAVAPVNAQPIVKAKANFVTAQAGGYGAVREVVDALLAERSNS
jgi:3-deoxy-D-manno-octulosonate 8-phosphate phosphatase (KDO 8-P phosphatase)